jgi:hypothetical protein
LFSPSFPVRHGSWGCCRRVGRERPPLSNHLCPWLRHLMALPIDFTPPRVWPPPCSNWSFFRPAMPLRPSSVVDRGSPTRSPQTPIGCTTSLATISAPPCAPPWSPTTVGAALPPWVHVASPSRASSGRTIAFGQASGYLYRAFGGWAHRNAATSIVDRLHRGGHLGAPPTA